MTYQNISQKFEFVIFVNLQNSGIFGQYKDIVESAIEKNSQKMSQEVVSTIQQNNNKENNYFIALVFVASSMRVQQHGKSHPTNTSQTMPRRCARSQSPMSLQERRSKSPMSLAAREEWRNDRRTIR